jgi:lysophospholipase L1-like esterase
MRATIVVNRATIIVLFVFVIVCSSPALSQPASAITIDWQVKSRFRLFKNEDDFNEIASYSGAGGVLAEETALAAKTDGKGWASDIVSRLCIDASGELADNCKRDYREPDGVHRETESLLNPADHKIEVQPSGLAAPTPCTWRLITSGDPTVQVREEKTCGKEVFTVPYHKTTQVQLFVAKHPENSQPTATVNVKVSDILIAGLGDSTASGEGDPDRAVMLDDNGFCFFRVGGNRREYIRPSRYGYDLVECTSSNGWSDWPAWSKKGAIWMNLACHRSLYSYQVRAALELAIENKHIAVTYIPLGCSGATINNGMIYPQSARETGCVPVDNCSIKVKGQIGALQQILSLAHKRDKNRNLDLVFLTVGANDINFSGLVANVMIRHESPEFRVGRLARDWIFTVDRARQSLNALSADFAQLRARLKPLLGNKLDHVVYVSYGNPALQHGGEPCPTTRRGFDVHPAFRIDGALLKTTSNFVNEEFFPRLKALATCASGSGCRSVAHDSMTFVDEHQAKFKDHGFCAQADNDPDFDRACFTDGNSFLTDREQALRHPLRCSKSPGLFRAYASRQRWIRTANDSYFAAMTYPDGIVGNKATDNLHDATWGLASVVYGGALHPTAQGYAAMADAALPAARHLLSLPEPPQPLRSNAE